MIDIQIIENRDILPITQFEYAIGVVPRTIILKGLDFDNVREVLVNETKSPSVVIESSTRLLAQIPDSIGRGPVRSVVAVSNRLTRTRNSMIRFRLSDTPSYVSGIERLIQTFLKLLLQTPGTDAFSPRLGGGVLKAAGKQSTNATAHANSLVADVKLGVDRTKRQLIAIQANDPTLALSEKLMYARLLDARFSPQEQTLFCRVDVANQALQSSVVNVET